MAGPFVRFPHDQRQLCATLPSPGPRAARPCRVHGEDPENSRSRKIRKAFLLRRRAISGLLPDKWCKLLVGETPPKKHAIQDIVEGLTWMDAVHGVTAFLAMVSQTRISRATGFPDSGETLTFDDSSSWRLFPIGKPPGFPCGS